MKGRVAIVGATGVTGGFAFDEAEQRDMEPIAIGRNATKLEAFLESRGLDRERMRVADAHEGEALKRALDGVPAVISTVAPFSEHGFPVAQAAAELGLGYTDPTGEGGFAQRLITELDALALSTGATLCTANGISAFIGDVAMHWITDKEPESSGAVVYDIRKYRPSAGTTESYLRYILPAGGPIVRDGVVGFEPFAAFRGGAGGLSGVHSVIPDPLVISRYWPARRIDGLFRSPGYLRPVARLAGRALLWQPVRDLILRLPLNRLTGYSPAADSSSSATALAEFRPGSGAVRRRRVRAREIYRFTGTNLVATVEAMLRRKQRPTGVRAASEMFSSFEEVLELTGLELLDEELVGGDAGASAPTLQPSSSAP